MTTKPTTTPTEKKRGPNPVLLAAVAVLVVLAVWLMRSRPEKGGHATSDKDTSHIKSPEIDTSWLGKIVGIGPAALALKSAGTEIVDPTSIRGLNALLDDTDVNAVIDALNQAGLNQLLVDPGSATRDPIPRSSVRSRLALGQPTGRLNAKTLSKKFFHYVIGKPAPELWKIAKTPLMAIARDAFAGGPGTVPADAPIILRFKGSWTAILTVRPLHDQIISYHSISDQPTLADAARKLGEKARTYYLKRKSLEKKYGPLDKALPTKLTLELEVLYDFGKFIGPRDKEFIWRIIEPGIHGFRINIDGDNYYMPPWYSVTNDLRLVGDLFDHIVRDVAKKKKGDWLRPDLSFERFRTIHWREKTPGGEIEDLYRASARIPSMQDINRENMVAALKGLADWIADNQTDPNGRYLYRYYPVKDEESNEYNIVRHCLGPFSMALAEEFTPNPKYKIKAEAGMKFIEDHIRWGGPPRQPNGEIETSATSWMGKPLPGPDVAILEFAEEPQKEWSAKMGGVAVAILGYTQYKRVGWQLSGEKEKVLRGLANFLLYMLNEKDGTFYHYYVGSKSSLYNTNNSIYPGEILYALGRLYGETKDERFRKAFKQSLRTSMKWFKDEMAKRKPDGTYEEEQRKNLVQFQPWIAMAMDEMYRYDPDPEYVEASNFVSLWIMDKYQFDDTRAAYPDYLGGYYKVLDELPAMHTFVYTEGVAASFDLARRAGADQETINHLRKGALLAGRFLIQQQARPGENDYYYPNPTKAKGAVRYCMNHNKQRIDYTYHALSSAYRIIRAATDEDYAYAQSIEMPKTW